MWRRHDQRLVRYVQDRAAILVMAEEIYMRSDHKGRQRGEGGLVKEITATHITKGHTSTYRLKIQ